MVRDQLVSSGDVRLPERPHVSQPAGRGELDHRVLDQSKGEPDALLSLATVRGLPASELERLGEGKRRLVLHHPADAPVDFVLQAALLGEALAEESGRPALVPDVVRGREVQSPPFRAIGKLGEELLVEPGDLPRLERGAPAARRASGRVQVPLDPVVPIASHPLAVDIRVDVDIEAAFSDDGQIGGRDRLPEGRRGRDGRQKRQRQAHRFVLRRRGPVGDAIRQVRRRRVEAGAQILRIFDPVRPVAGREGVVRPSEERVDAAGVGDRGHDREADLPSKSPQG